MTPRDSDRTEATERAIERAENEAWFAAHEPDPLGWAADRAADRYERQRDSAW